MKLNMILDEKFSLPFGGTKNKIITYLVPRIASKIISSASTFSQAFRVPIFMVFVPFLMHIVLENFNNPKLIQVSIILLISIVLTTILGFVFNDVVFNLFDYLGVGKHY